MNLGSQQQDVYYISDDENNNNNAEDDDLFSSDFTLNQQKEDKKEEMVNKQQLENKENIITTIINNNKEEEEENSFNLASPTQPQPNIQEEEIEITERQEEEELTTTISSTTIITKEEEETNNNENEQQEEEEEMTLNNDEQNNNNNKTMEEQEEEEDDFFTSDMNTQQHLSNNNKFTQKSQTSLLLNNNSINNNTTTTTTINNYLNETQSLLDNIDNDDNMEEDIELLNDLIDNMTPPHEDNKDEINEDFNNLKKRKYLLQENDENDENNRPEPTEGFISAANHNFKKKKIVNINNDFLSNFINDIQSLNYLNNTNDNNLNNNNNTDNNNNLNNKINDMMISDENKEEEEEKPPETFGFVKSTTIKNNSNNSNFRNLNNNNLNNKNLNNKKDYNSFLNDFINELNHPTVNDILNNNEQVDNNNNQINNKMVTDKEENERPTFVNAKNVNNITKMEKVECNEEQLPPETIGFVSAKSTSNFKKPTTTLITSHKEENDEKQENERLPETFGFVSAKSSNHFTKTITNKGNVMVESLPPATNGFISAGKSTKSNFLQNFIKDLQEPLQQKEQTFNKQESDDDEINDEDLKEILQHEELLLEKEKQEKPLETFGFVKANNNFIKKQSTLMNENIEMNNNEINNNEMNNNDKPPETFGFVNAKNVNNVKKHTLQNAVQTTLQNMLLNNNQLNNQQLNNNQQDENKENDKPPETFGFVSAKSSSFKKPSAITPQKVEQEEDNETENNDKPPETFGFVSAKSTNSSNFKKPTSTIVNNSPNKVNNNVDNSTNQERPPETFGFVSAKRSTGNNNNFNNKNSNNKNNKQQKSSSFLDSFMKDIQNISNLVDDETKQLITIDNNNNNDNNNDNNERPPATSGFISAASTKSSSFNSSPSSSSSFKTPLKTMNNQQQQQKQQQQQTTMTPKSDFLSKFIADVNNGTFNNGDNNENNNSSTLTTPFKTPSSSSGVNNSSNNNNSNRRLSNVSSSSSSLLSTPQSSSQMSTSLFKTPQKRDVKTPFSAYYNNSSNNNKTTTTPTTTTATPTNRILSIPKKKKFVTPMKSLQAFEEAQRRERNNIVKNTTNNGSTTLTTSTTKKEGSGSSLDPIIPPNWIPMKKTSLQRKATNSKKIPLSKLGTCQHLNLLKTKLNNSILEMNSLKAKDFKFNHKDFPFCKELQNLIFTIFKKNLEIIGVDEIFKICKHLGIVNRKIEWFDNHYRFIVWKLACMDRTFPNDVTTTTSLQNVVDNHVTDNIPAVVDNTCHKNRFLTCEKVIGQLIYRYNVEYCLGKRSCLQQITEQDQPPSKFMILMVASISSNNTNSDNSENKIIELTDGWYSIKGKLDETLSRYVEWFKLREGQKLKICGAQFSEQTEAGHPLEISNCCITLNVNSVKLAKWDDPLGFQPFRTLPFKSTIKSIQPNGGTIPFLQVIVKRIFPVRFMEKLENGTFIVRSENAENKLKEQNERERERKSQFLMEKFTQEMSQKELQKMSQKKLSQKKNVTGGTPINRIYDGPSLYEALQNSNDKFTFYSQLQDKQRETLQNYENKLQQEKSQKIQEKIQMELENDVTFNRQVNSMMNVLIGDCCQFTKKLLQKRKLLNGVKNNTQNVSQNNCDNNCDNHSDNNTNIENNCDNNCDNIEMTENEDDISGITINEKEAMLTIWNPQIEHFELFKEGNIVDIFSSKPSKNSNDNNSLMKSINTTKFTKIRIHKYSYQLTNKEKELFHFKNRKVFKLIDLINPLNFVNENLIDLIGVVIFTKELPKKEKDGILKFITILDDTSFNNFTQNNCDNTLQNNNPHDNIPEITKKPLTLQISFLETMKKQYGYKLIENQIYCFFNLKFHEYSSQYNLIKCFVTDQTLICERPPKEFTHLKREFLLNFYNENKLLFENYKNLLKQQQFIYNNDYNKFVENNLEENLENNNLENSLQNPLQNNLENNLQNNSKNGKDELNNISCNLMIDIHHPITITLIDSSFVTLENYNYPTVHLPNNFNYLQNFKNSLQNSLQNNLQTSLQNNNELYSYYKNCEDIYTFTMKCYLQNNSINGREQIIKLNENLFDQFINCTFLQQEENSQTTILQNTLQNNKNYNLEEIPLWINKLIQEGIILEDVDDYSIKVPDIILNLKDCMNHHYMAKSRLLLFRNLNTSINKSINNSSSINSSSSINNNKDNKMEDDNNEMKDEEEEEEEMMINKKEEELNNNNFSLSNVLKLIFMKTKFILNVNDFDEEESIKNQLFYCTRKEWHYLMYHFINTFIKPLYRFVLYNSDRDVKEIECLCLDKDELNLDF